MAEKSKKRNLSFNFRHHEYGKELYMFDGDAILYTKEGKPVAWLETKYGDMNEIELNGFQINCFKSSCELKSGTIPLFILYYYTYSNGQRLSADDNITKICDFAQYAIIGVNEEAKKIFPELT